MDSELLLKFIGYFRDYRFGIVAYAFTLFLVNLCRNSCIYNFFFFGGGGGGGGGGGLGVCVWEETSTLGCFMSLVTARKRTYRISNTLLFIA